MRVVFEHLSAQAQRHFTGFERRAFIELLQNPKTHERIMGMLNTGKPVRN